MLAPVTHVLPLTSVRRARALPVRGRVLVRVGQKITATDMVAETTVERKHVMLDVRRSLGLGRLEQANRAIVRRPGEIVKQGDVIAQTSGMFKRVLRAPVDGDIAAVGGGQVLMEIAGPVFGIQAGISGTVAEIIPERGAVIEGNGGLIQGVWGNKRIDQGMLTVLLRSPGDDFTRKSADVSMRGAILLGGYCIDSEALKAAADLALRGLILGSMPASLVGLASQMSFPIILLEGFGRIPVNSAAFRVLTTSDKRDVTLNACVWAPFQGERPEIFIPLPAEGETFAETTDFARGDAVRIVGQPYLGKTGILEEVKPGLTLLSNGLRTPAAVVRLEDDSQVIVPLANLDVLQ